MKIEPGICDICEKEKDQTAKQQHNGMRVCSDCGRLDTIKKKDNKRVRSSEQERQEKTLRLNNSKWMGR